MSPKETEGTPPRLATTEKLPGRIRAVACTTRCPEASEVALVESSGQLGPLVGQANEMTIRAWIPVASTTVRPRGEAKAVLDLRGLLGCDCIDDQGSRGARPIREGELSRGSDAGSARGDEEPSSDRSGDRRH